MAKFTKSVLKVGDTFQSPEGPIPITAERLKHFTAEHHRLTAAGYDVPSRWEHADKVADLLPLSTEEFTKQLDGRHAVGRMVDIRLLPGGQQAELLMDISDSCAADQCDTNRVKVSPVIAAWWRDGHGNTYSDFISHADLVERPVDYSQGPFKRVDESQPAFLACSLEKFLDQKVIRMSLEDEKNDDSENDTTAKTETKEPEKNPDMPPVAKEADPKTEAIIAGLAQLGAVVPSDWTLSGDSSVDVLLAAINSALAARVKAETDNTDNDDKNDEPVTVASPSYASMSTEKNPMFVVAQRKYREGLSRDIDRNLAEGRISPHEAQTYKAAVSTLRMSLDAKGNELESDVENFLKSRNGKEFAGLFFSAEAKTQRMAAEPATHPSPDSRTGVTEDERSAEEIAKQVHSRNRR